MEEHSHLNWLEREKSINLCLGGGAGEVHFVRRQVCFILVTFLRVNLFHVFFSFFTNHVSCQMHKRPLHPSSGFWTLAPAMFIVCVRRASQLCFSGSAPTPVRAHPHPSVPQPRAPSRAPTKRITLRVVALFLPRESTGPIQCLE